MHPTASEIQVPVERIEKEFCRYAVPGFSGSRTVHLRVRQEAALAVEFISEGLEAQRIGERQACISPSLLENSEPTERQLKVKATIARNRNRMSLVMKITKVTAHYIDGHINRFDLNDCPVEL